MRSLVLISACSAGLSACVWTEFDDLSDETWVRSTEKPDNGAANWGVAIQRVNRTGEGGKLAVIGLSQAVYSDITYDDAGETSIASSALPAGVAFDAQPVVLADPANDRAAVIGVQGDRFVIELTNPAAPGQVTDAQVFNVTEQNPNVDAAAFMIAPGFGGSTSPQPAQPIVASDSFVRGAVFSPPGSFAQGKCQLRDGGNPVQVKGLAAVRGLDPGNPGKVTDDLVVWGSDGNLYIYDGDAFNGGNGTVCAGETLEPFAGTKTQTGLGFMPEATQVIVLDNQLAVLQAHDGSRGFLAVFDLVAKAMVGAPQQLDGLKIIDVMTVGTQRFIAAGFPQALVAGTRAGEVRVFELSATGISATPKLSLSDAEPENNQSFGRGVAGMPYNNKLALVVAADNEVFTYFRLDPLYPETRNKEP